MGASPLSLTWRIEKKQLLDLLTRQSLELSLYQQQLSFGLEDITTVKDRAQKISALIPNSAPLLAQDFDFLHPLLLAYDSRVHRLEALIKDSSSDLQIIQQNAQRIADQNKRLRAELEEKSIQLTRVYKRGVEGQVMGETLLEIEVRGLELRVKELEGELVLLHENVGILVCEKSGFAELRRKLEGGLREAVQRRGEGDP